MFEQANRLGNGVRGIAGVLGLVDVDCYRLSKDICKCECF